MKNKNFGRKRQAIYILSNRKSTRIIKTLMDFFFFIKVKIKMVCFSVPSPITERSDTKCPVRDGLKQQKNAKAKAAYRQKYESDFIIADAAARYFRENGISKLPSYKALQAEIETLIQEKNSGYNDYRAKREEYRRLQTVKGNIDQILHRERKPVKRQEQER